MPNNESIHDRITQLVNEFGGGKNTTFASIIGSSEANVRGYRGTVMPKYDFLEKIARSFDVNLKWLLTGEGSMLRENENLESPKLACTPNVTPISPVQESIIYNMYRDEKAEKERMLKEKDAKIDQLQIELRSVDKELTMTKIKLSQYEPEVNKVHPKVLDSPAKDAGIKPPSLTSGPSVGYAKKQPKNQ